MASKTAPKTNLKSRTGGNGDRPLYANYVKLTLRVGAQPENQFSESGAYWVRLRASLYIGKDGPKESTSATGNYKPSKWFTVKAFAKEGDEKMGATVDALAALNVGDRVTLAGKLDYIEYTRRDGSPGSEDVLITFKVGPFDADAHSEKFEEPQI
jgi:hypothetical protein